MVFFCCDECGESLKKIQVEKHKNRCYSNSYSCIDCQVRFTPTSYAKHIKCITENQKYGGKAYVEKAAKGETKQQAWVSLVSGAISNVTDPNLKWLLEKIQDYDNIPRKEAKFVNFLANSFRIRDKNLCQQAWNVIQQESDKLKKQAEEEKKSEEFQAATSGTKETESLENEIEKKSDVKSLSENPLKKRVSEKLKEEPTEETNENATENGTSSAQEIVFKWKATIKRKLKEAGGEMKIKRLRKAVISDYEQAGGNADEAESLFNEKLEKAGVTVDGKIVQLA